MFSNLSMNDSTSKIAYPIADSSLSFEQYINICRQLIESRRNDLTESAEIAKKIVDANSPYLLMPAGKIAQDTNTVHEQGALLIHGLYDCPFTMRDIGHVLQQNGILCHSILLPGHGTKPADLLHTSYHEWIQTVRYGIQSMRKQVKKIFLVGYSTGAALAIHHAQQDPSIAGVVLISPAVQLHSYVQWGLMWHGIQSLFGKNNAWLHREKEIDYTKYRSLTFNSVQQVIALTKMIQASTVKNSLNVATLMILSQDDETICPNKAIEFFTHLPNPANRLLLYASKKASFNDARVQVRPIESIDPTIESYSHVCLPFSPNNFHYGKEGDFLPITTTENKPYLHGAYNRAIEQYYHLLYKLGILQKDRRKLTYNPDFDYLANEISRFIQTDLLCQA